MLFERWTRRQLVVLDCVAVALFVLVTIGATSGGWTGLLPAIAALPVAVRRLWPVPVLGLTLLATAVSVGFGVVAEPFFAVAFALYTVAVMLPKRRWVPTRLIGVLGGVGLVAAATVGPVGWLPVQPGQLLGEFVLGFSVVCVGWALGRAVRDRRDYIARVAEEEAERAVTEERLRIARELHDVVAHSMSVITVKAGVAAHVAADRPSEVVDALRVIERTGRETLGEMRHLLDVLRSDGQPTELAPSPGLSRLNELVERAGMAGVRVDLDVRGTADLPHGVELSVYRIVQEAVTNVMKHAAPARCLVRIELAATEVRIDVTDDGPGVRVLPDGGGHGLVGMRERVATYGGTFSAGPRDSGGFAVHALLPYAGSR
ncbi:sensor histidine kinase [Tenggerimyces flavus]|uniref:histidine kinase n=1 Tax=Tenggerimyces flavus TaxID=1708749 RepID=A0ABV7YJV5_9ACTN|nr:sensor histidine kinase [Tenggerimyces flavus]MBM7784054.1 signal transduction histidine kinase [Tenggerimyces flavus]